MVLVSNEWLNLGDEVHKSTTESENQVTNVNATSVTPAATEPKTATTTVPAPTTNAPPTATTTKIASNIKSNKEDGTTTTTTTNKTNSSSTSLTSTQHNPHVSAELASVKTTAVFDNSRATALSANTNELGFSSNGRNRPLVIESGTATIKNKKKNRNRNNIIESSPKKIGGGVAAKNVKDNSHISKAIVEGAADLSLETSREVPSANATPKAYSAASTSTATASKLLATVESTGITAATKTGISPTGNSVCYGAVAGLKTLGVADSTGTGGGAAEVGVDSIWNNNKASFSNFFDTKSTKTTGKPKGTARLKVTAGGTLIISDLDDEVEPEGEEETAATIKVTATGKVDKLGSSVKGDISRCTSGGSSSGASSDSTAIKEQSNSNSSSESIISCFTSGAAGINGINSSGNTNKTSNTFLSSLGMGVATNMQTQQQQQQQSMLNNTKSSYSNPNNTILTPNNNISNINTINNNNNNNNNTNNNNTNINNNNNNNNNTLINSGGNGLGASYSSSNNLCLINNSSATSNSTSTSGTIISSASYPTMNDNNNQAKIILICEATSHPFQTRTISLTPNIECKVGRLIAKTKANDSNAIFDCKVLSRNHAVLWYSDDGKFWVKDTKSSNGTFINDNKLGNDAAELHFDDIVKFGVDVYENSRQESHGCIIACVKLYLPDGREAISIDSHSSRSLLTNDGRITFEEMHRLNMYMQEAAQREKCLKTKLCSIQNVLDSTRKNSALCWQAMINEDQLIHRINSLEKKLQIVEKNVPESALRNEVLKLIDDKNTYQITAKEALRKVYQERCDALQMLAKVESAYATAENECSLLRDEILATKETMQEIYQRLTKMETDFNTYKDEIDRQQTEAKQESEELIKALKEQLKRREQECDKLQNEVLRLQNLMAGLSSSSSAFRKNSNLQNDADDEAAKQAIEKLDDAIGSFADFADNDNDDDDEDDDDGMDGDPMIDVSSNIFNQSGFNNDELDALNSIENVLAACDSDKSKKKSKQKAIKKSTVMKWFKNSDLQKEKGSMDILKAMFNDVDDVANDECMKSGSDIDQNNDNNNRYGAGAICDRNSPSSGVADSNNFNLKYKNFKYIIDNVVVRLDNFIDEFMGMNEKREEGGAAVVEKDGQKMFVESVTSKDADADADNDLDKDKDKGDFFGEAESAEDEFIMKSTTDDLLNSTTMGGNEANKEETDNQKQSKLLNKQSQSFLQLKKSFEALRKAYIELGKAYRPYQQTVKANSDENELDDDAEDLNANGDGKQYSIKANDNSDDDNDEAGMKQDHDDADKKETSEFNKNDAENDLDQRTREELLKQELKKEEDFKVMQEQIEEMKSRLYQTEMESNHTLEIMQIELDTYKMKANVMLRTIEKLTEEKQELQDTLTENNIKIVPGNKPDPHAGLNKLSSGEVRTISTMTIPLSSSSSISSSSSASSSTSGSSSAANMPINTTAALKFSGSAAAGSMESGIDTSGMGSGVGALTTSGISELQSSSQTDNKFELEMAEDRAAAMDAEREEELVAFKELLAKEQQNNHNLLIELEAYKKNCGAGMLLVRNLVPLGIAALAALIYFTTQYF